MYKKYFLIISFIICSFIHFNKLHSNIINKDYIKYNKLTLNMFRIHGCFWMKVSPILHIKHVYIHHDVHMDINATMYISDNIYLKSNFYMKKNICINNNIYNFDKIFKHVVINNMFGEIKFNVLKFKFGQFNIRSVNKFSNSIENTNGLSLSYNIFNYKIIFGFFFIPLHQHNNFLYIHNRYVNYLNKHILSLQCIRKKKILNNMKIINFIFDNYCLLDYGLHVIYKNQLYNHIIYTNRYNQYLNIMLPKYKHTKILMLLLNIYNHNIKIKFDFMHKLNSFYNMDYKIYDKNIHDLNYIISDMYNSIIMNVYHIVNNHFKYSLYMKMYVKQKYINNNYNVYKYNNSRYFFKNLKKHKYCLYIKPKFFFKPMNNIILTNGADLMFVLFSNKNIINIKKYLTLNCSIIMKTNEHFYIKGVFKYVLYDYLKDKYNIINYNALTFNIIFGMFF